MTEISLPVWSYAYAGPQATGQIKTQPDDFFVDEILGFAPEGSGEHVFLHIEKRGENTEYIARLLARHADVRQRDIGFAGLKDRHGCTRQWFSIWLPGKQDPDWSALENDNIKILQVSRHARKLKRGVLTANRFKLLIRNWQGPADIVEQQLTNIQQHGFPNYFGEQRFGHNGNNINRALAMFSGSKVKREQRSIYLSAARAFLFNLVLAERVKNQNWQQALSGELLMLNNSHSFFRADDTDSQLTKRLSSGDIHPSGPLFGHGNSQPTDAALALEQQIIAHYPELVNGLLSADLESARRPLRAKPEELHWQFENEKLLSLEFQLPAGSYATALLREIMTIEAVD
jgi:tRNA pseudouridine13 synthase